MIMTLDLAGEVEEVKFYFLGDGNLDGVVELEDYYLGWGLVETKNNKFLVKCQKSDDNNFYLAFEYFEWERYRTKFRKSLSFWSYFSYRAYKTSRLHNPKLWSIPLWKWNRCCLYRNFREKIT